MRTLSHYLLPSNQTHYFLNEQILLQEKMGDCWEGRKRTLLVRKTRSPFSLLEAFLHPLKSIQPFFPSSWMREARVRQPAIPSGDDLVSPEGSAICCFGRTSIRAPSKQLLTSLLGKGFFLLQRSFLTSALKITLCEFALNPSPTRGKSTNHKSSSVRWLADQAFPNITPSSRANYSLPKLTHSLSFIHSPLFQRV